MESGIAALQAKYEDCLANKEELDNKFQLCGARLIRADKVRRMGEVKSILRLIFTETVATVRQTPQASSESQIH